MIRWILWIVGGAVMGGIVHLATILVLPRTATQDAYSRIAAVSPENAVVALADPAPTGATLPFMDPAFSAAVCRYDLTRGGVKFVVPVSAAYTSVSFYTRAGIAYYAINDRAAGRRTIELELMTPAQRARLPDEDDVTSADRLIVESPSDTGLIVVRALAPEPGMMPAAKATLAGARCQN